MDQGLIPLILPPHIAAGAVALVCGYVALYALKGAALHRKSGMLFVCAMVVLGLSGASIAAIGTPKSVISMVSGFLACYLVTTSLITVRPRSEKSWWIDRGAMVTGLVVGAVAFACGFALLGSGRPETIPAFMFGTVGLLGAAGDRRVIREAGIDGRRRIARHLWRMCFAMWIAAASFFWGPAGRVPEVIRIPPLLAAAVLTPIAAMLYWFWRLRSAAPRAALVHSSR